MDDMLRGDSHPSFLRMLFRHAFFLFPAILAVTALASAQTEDFSTLLRKAQRGDAKAQFDLASAFSQGNGVAIKHDAPAPPLRAGNRE